MSYIDRYNRFIDSLKNQSIVGLSEKHHIVPKSMGGTDDKSNLIALTPRQHYIAHWMLWKAYSGKMAQAFHFMNIHPKYKKLNGRLYEKLRTEAIEYVRKTNKGRKISKEERLLMSARAKQYYEKNPEKKKLARIQLLSIEIPKEAYEKQAKIISSLVWMNDGNRSYRIRPELVQENLNNGLSLGRLMTFIHDKEYKMNQKLNAIKQWKSIKAAGHNNLKGSVL